MCTNVFLSMPGTLLIFLLPYIFSHGSPRPLNFVLHLKLSVVDAQFMVALQQSRENEKSSCPIFLNMTQILWYLIEFCAFTPLELIYSFQD